MFKKSLPLLLITSVIIVIPMLIGLTLWNMLPDQLPIQWNIEGEVDGYSSKAMAVFALPLFLLAMHWFCTLVTCSDPKHQDISNKTMTLVLWICPLLSLLLGSVVYAAALGFGISVEIIIPLFLGALFIVIGNYMPKCKQNYTIGIKLPWTLNDPENWNKTHRLAGVLWVIGGVVIMGSAFLGTLWIPMASSAVMVIVPTIYSYCYYRKTQK